MKRYKLLGTMIVSVALAFSMSMNVMAAESMTSEDYDKLVGFIKEELRDGNLDTQEDVKKAIEEAEDKYDIEFSAEEEKRVLDVMNTVNSLGLDKEELADKVDSVYDKVGDELGDNVEEAIDTVIDQAKDELVDTAKNQVKTAVKKSFLDYMSDFKEHIAEMIDKVLGKA